VHHYAVLRIRLKGLDAFEQGKEVSDLTTPMRVKLQSPTLSSGTGK